MPKEMTGAPVPPPKTQFPDDPNRAAEAGFTYGEAAPEMPGKKMITPLAEPHPVPPTSKEMAQRMENKADASAKRRDAQLTKDIQDFSEKVGPRGNFREG